MAKRTLPWLPWLLAEGTLGFLQAQMWPTGGLWLLLLWTAALLALPSGDRADLPPRRPSRR